MQINYWFIFNQFRHSASACDVRACASTGDSLCVVHTWTRLKDHLYVRILRNSWLTCTNSTAYSQQVASNYTCSHFLVFLCEWGINSTKVSSKTKKEMVFDIILFFMYTFFVIARTKIEILIYHLISIWPCFWEDLTKMFTVTLKIEEIIHSTMQNEFE